MIPAELLQDRNRDGLVDYLNARIYVGVEATPDEIAAAANIAARLAFETLSLDLPIGFTMPAYHASETTVALVIGTAAKRFTDDAIDGIVVTRDGSRTVVAIPNASDAERFARSLGSEIRIEAEKETELKGALREKQFSLASLYSIEGLLGGKDGDWVSERIQTAIVLGPDVHSVEVIDLAARIALEVAGIRLPLVITDLEGDLPPHAIVVGQTNRYFKRRNLTNPLLPDLPPGHGRIEIVDRSPEHSAFVAITGADAEGESEALQHAAERLPFAWNYGKQELHLHQIENDIAHFFSCRSPAGQAAAALCEAREIVKKLDGEDPKSARLEILVDGDCRPCLDYIAAQFPDLRVAASNLNVQTGPLVFEDTYPLPWEVDDARQQIRSIVIPRIQAGSRVEIDLRVSESPQVRSSLAREIEDLIQDSGVEPGNCIIRVLSAHKQAYCWIDEFLKPRMRQASRIRIVFREVAGEAHTVIESAQRWLHELYPIDDVLSRDLGIPLDNITFHKSGPGPGPTYELFADDATGQTILHETFEPKFVMRPMFDAFPEYATVRVGTGWLQASIDGSVIADERIETDPEKFWNSYQTGTLPKIRDYILQLYDGNPKAEYAPHFGILEIELWLSEPDYRIGIGEERISTLEALHEDIYFETLLFFEILGLTSPGRIIPRIHRARDSQDGFARIRFTGKAGPNPRVDLRWKDRDGNSLRHTIDLLPLLTAAPRITSLTVCSRHPSVVSLDIADVPAGKEGMVESLREFHEHGVGLSWLSYENIALIRLGSVEIPRTPACFKKPRIEPLPASGFPIVQWENPIGPEECEQMIRQLAVFPEVRPFHAGTSYLGNDIWALDVVAPSTGKYISQARESVTKPVLFITGRQHANEVSSTSHILKLAECLATDPEIRKLLDRVNFILQPITNPDGAAIVGELGRDTPDFMLHAGYLGSLGTDVTAGQWAEHPLLPEAHVRPDLWKMWLPDVILNPHGYPSHEWIQLFAGYTAWVKSRSATARDWWIPRGWFIPGFQFMESSVRKASHFREHVSAAMRQKLGPWNDQMYRRYAKYGAAEPDTFKLQFCNDLLVYSLPKVLRPSPVAPTFMQRFPQVTILEIVTEVPDEVAHGVWLETLAQAGLEFSLACAEYLAENNRPVERTIQHFQDSTVLRISRNRL